MLAIRTWQQTSLRMTVNFALGPEYAIKNQAHQLIYKSIAQKLGALRKRRQEFIDESARLFLTEYEKYRKDTSKNLA
jgi:hypothetical protein